MRLIDLIIKDVKNIIYDRKSLALILLMPIVLTTILSFALRGNFEAGDSGIRIITIGVVKEYDLELENRMFENHMASYITDEVELGEFFRDIEEINPEKLFFQDFLGNENVKEYVQYIVLNKEEAIQQLNRNEISAIVVLPKRYIYDTYVNLCGVYKNKVNIDVIKTSDAQFSGTIVESMIEGYNNMLNTFSINKDTVIGVLSIHFDMERAFEEYYAEFINGNINNEEIRLIERTVEGKKQIDSFAYYSMAIMTMFILYSAGYGGRAMLQEKHEFTYHRLKVAGITKKKLYFGAFFTTFIIAFLQSMMMIVYSSFVLKVNWGNIGLVFLVTLLITLGIGSIGVLISAISIKTNSFKVANLFENGIVFFLAVIGGSFTPIYLLPEFLQRLSDFSINGVGLKMYSNIMMGSTLEALLNHILIIIAMIVVFIIAATLVIITGKEAD
ncbi:ABC-type multidrug transport system permease subunit [Natranaerovirga pectinivora]|uniref:ABC-type multidrug transport system permease subunit n=1 Tax=Natranaerovirga pectinivora TaxID=682400 RepID=A0A4R3MIF3_9FIRM|nr:ABC transporter permease [Natranaerovirga pectinivora]TCT13103.1 ABC-type multidrug transport system permease subunit [Natranaerovirga pectinivora]